MSYRVIELSQNYVAIIDSSDYRRVNRHTWHVHKSRGRGKKEGHPYARATIKGKKVYLHRFVMQSEGPEHVDHINHCTLDCRRSNLEIVDNLTNQRRKRNVKTNQRT